MYKVQQAVYYFIALEKSFISLMKFCKQNSMLFKNVCQYEVKLE